MISKIFQHFLPYFLYVENNFKSIWMLHWLTDKTNCSMMIKFVGIKNIFQQINVKIKIAIFIGTFSRFVDTKTKFIKFFNCFQVFRDLKNFHCFLLISHHQFSKISKSNTNKILLMLYFDINTTKESWFYCCESAGLTLKDGTKYQLSGAMRSSKRSSRLLDTRPQNHSSFFLSKIKHISTVSRDNILLWQLAIKSFFLCFIIQKFWIKCLILM